MDITTNISNILATAGYNLKEPIHKIFKESNILVSAEFIALRESTERKGIFYLPQSKDCFFKELTLIKIIDCDNRYCVETLSFADEDYGYILISNLIEQNSLFNLLQRTKKLPEPIALALFKQILETAIKLEELPEESIYPIISTSTIYLDDQKRILLSGWTHIEKLNSIHLSEALLGLGEVLFCFLTGRPPFFSHSVHDPHFKFIRKDYIHLLWESSSFAKLIINPVLRDLFEHLFLGNFQNLRAVRDHAWVSQEHPSQCSLFTSFSELETKVKLEAEQKRIRLLNRQTSRRNEIESVKEKTETPGSRDKKNMSEFHEYYTNRIVPYMSLSKDQDCHGYILMADNRPEFILATLASEIDEAIGTEKFLEGSGFRLIKGLWGEYEEGNLEKVHRLELCFEDGEKHNSLDNEQDQISIVSYIKFRMSPQGLMGKFEIEKEEKNIDWFCLQLKQEIEEEIQWYPEVKK